MAKKPTASATVKKFLLKPRKKRKGIHAKTKHSHSKKGKNYAKAYRGQGKRR
jgi:hypothetical protein